MSNAGFCTVCRHTKVEKIEAFLLAGQSMRALARRYGVSRHSLARHREKHIPKQLAAAAERAVEKREDGLLSTFEWLVADARRIAKKAEASGDLPTALLGLREITRLIELAAVHAPKEKREPFNVTVTFGPQGAQARKEPIDAEAPTAAEKPEPPPATPSKPPAAKTLSAPRPPSEPPVRAPVQQRHVHTSRCNTFTCVVKARAAEEREEEDKYRPF